MSSITIHQSYSLSLITTLLLESLRAELNFKRSATFKHVSLISSLQLLILIPPPFVNLARGESSLRRK